MSASRTAQDVIVSEILCLSVRSSFQELVDREPPFESHYFTLVVFSSYTALLEYDKGRFVKSQANQSSKMARHVSCGDALQSAYAICSCML